MTFLRTTSRSALSVAFVAVLFSQTAIAQGSTNEIRMWTSKDGKFSVEASFVSFSDGNVKLQKDERSVIDVPVDRLSLDDHKYISSTGNWGRVWRSAAGKELYVAKLESLDGNRVRLTSITGKRIRIHVSSLDGESREFILRQRNGVQSSEEAPPGAASTTAIALDASASDAAIRKLIAACELNSRRLRVDGLANDWNGLPVFYDGTPTANGSLDIQRVGIAPRESDLIVMIQTRLPPARDNYSFFVRVDFLGQGGKDIQLALSQSSPQSMKVHDEANSFELIAEMKLDGPIVKIGEVVEVQIPYTALRSVLPKQMGDVLSGQLARPYVRVEVLSFDQATRSIVDYGPSAASFRFLKNEYPLDPVAPGDVRETLPVSVPFEGKWFVGNGAMGYAGHVGIHAYDFMIMDRQLQRAKVRGSADNHDYYSFGQPILNPIECVVTRTESKEPDGTPLVKVTKRSNKVVSAVRGSGGHEMLLYHFQQDKVDVEEGQHLKKGDVVGMCGNSGTSRAAHLHMELIASKVQGKAETLPITLERAIVSLNPGPDDPWARYVENWEIRGGVFVEPSPTTGSLER